MPKPGKPLSKKSAAKQADPKQPEKQTATVTVGPMIASSSAAKPLKPSFKPSPGLPNRGLSGLGKQSDRDVLPMRRAALFSLLGHLLGPLAVAVTVLLTLLILSLLLHLNFWDWFKPKPAKPDLEFTLVSDTHAARPEQARFKGNFNQRAGGRHHRLQPLKPVEKPPQASQAPKKPAQPTPPQAAIKPQPTHQAEPTPPAPEKPLTQEKPSPPEKPVNVAKPAPKPAPPKAVQASQPFADASQATASQAPPVATTGTTFSAPADGGDSAANPQDGPSATAGVDVAEDVDFGPFMADLERRIKKNWLPPRGSESRKVMLLFYIARDGRVVRIDTKVSSGDADADRAAIEAVRAAAPFQAFPPQVKEEVLPVEFSFDYNVLNPKNPKQALKW